VGGRVVLGANELPHVALLGCGGRGQYVARAGDRRQGPTNPERRC
jgi:hypothetical protein